MDALVDSGLPMWKVATLVAMTLLVVGASHVHSAREAWAGMTAKGIDSRWRQVLSYLGRHEVAYAKRVPLLIFFVISATAVVYTL
jgi:hypothetical protein